jgi:glycerol-1-phosphate dehydrogenase [NAD(P)+]
MSSPIAHNLFEDSLCRSFGRRPDIDPREVVYAVDALERLPEICARAVPGRRATVLMDERTRCVAGVEAAAALRRAGWTVAEMVVPDPAPDKSPVCDDVTKDALTARLGEADLLLAVGSGVINDLTKWLAYERRVPYVAFATAASMNGYTSANVAPAVCGVKTLVRGAAPVAVLSSPAVLRKAPAEMTAAGLGDVLAKSVSSVDWRLNHLLFGDEYLEDVVNLVAAIEPLYLDHSEDLRAGRPEAFEALFAVLNLTGVSMTLARTSAPASGGEHMLSHSLDMMSSVDGAAHDLHGRQVGVGTILACELYRRVLAVESPQFVAPPMEIDREFWYPLGDVVAHYYAEKQTRLGLAREKLSRGDAWDRLREQLSPLVRPAEVTRDCLRRAGAATTAADIKCDRARLLAAFLHAHEIRSRFTILDLARLVGLLPDAAAEIVHNWA